MKAIGACQYLPTTASDCLISFEAPEPIPGPLDLLVEIKACSINPVDSKIRASLDSAPIDPPRILGWDAAGTVLAIGDQVTGFSYGDDVFYAGDLTKSGCNAERQAVDSRLVARKPTTWSFAESASIPLVGLTAWELLFERMGISPDGSHSGQPILLINGAGGVGSAAISLARMAGLHVIATASRPETTEWCVSRGAHHVINHHHPLRPQLEALGIHQIPWIANFHQPETLWTQTADLLAPMGTLGLIVEPKSPVHIGDPLKAKCARVVWEFMAARARFQLPDMHIQGEILARLATLCDNGTIPSLVTRHLGPLTPSTLREAHQAMESSSAHGKWVFETI
jgi:NADPH2:quinone reductase